EGRALQTPSARPLLCYLRSLKSEKAEAPQSHRRPKTRSRSRLAPRRRAPHSHSHSESSSVSSRLRVEWRPSNTEPNFFHRETCEGIRDSWPTGLYKEVTMAATLIDETVRERRRRLSQWEGFENGHWQRKIDVRDFIQQNYRPYEGDESFLQGPTERTQYIWNKLKELFVEEKRKGVLDVSQIPSSITAHAPGYIDRDHEIIVGLQTEAPLKRAIMPNGGLRMVLGALKAYGYVPDPEVIEIFSKHRKTHNDGVFDAYTSDVKKCRSAHILTGLPDAYGRGRIIGDYRRVALYGVATLIHHKQQEKQSLDSAMSGEPII